MPTIPGAPAPGAQPRPPATLQWHSYEIYGFVHFTVNTFTDLEWGLGGESPAIFNPVELDARQWARVAKESGLKGIGY